MILAIMVIIFILDSLVVPTLDLQTDVASFPSSRASAWNRALVRRRRRNLGLEGTLSQHHDMWLLTYIGCPLKGLRAASKGFGVDITGLEFIYGCF